MDFISALISELGISLLITLSLALVFNFIWSVFGNHKYKTTSEKISYSKKLKRLTSNLEKSSKEVDSLVGELSKIAEEREENVRKIETDLANLQSREKELKEKIENLEKVPLPVAEYFAELTSHGEKRSARRDYLLFGAGAIVSTVITIILKLVFGI